MMVQCPFCGTKEAVPEEYAGMVGECGRCGRAYTVPRSHGGDHPVLSFLVGFLFNLFGILVIALIDKRNVGKAVLGALASFACGIAITVFIAIAHQEAVEAAGATTVLSEEDGWKARKAADEISFRTVKELGE